MGSSYWLCSFAHLMPDSQMIASGGDDQLLKLWDVKTGQCRRVLHNHDGTVWAITASLMAK